MKRGLTSLPTLLAAALAVMVVGLAALIVVVHLAVAELGRMNNLIVADTAPSVVALQRMNVDVANLRTGLRAALSASADVPAERSRTAAARRALEQHHEEWLSLPVDPDEGELMGEANLGIKHLDDLTRRILTTAPSAPASTRDALLAELDATTTGLEVVILRATQLNADLAGEATGVSARVGRRLLHVAVGVEVVSLLLAALALAAAYRVSRSEKALSERRLLQQKNTELEAFSARVAHDVLSPLMTVSLAMGMAEQRLSSPGDERVHGALERAGLSLQRVRQVVADLLEFARAAAPPPAGETEVAPLLRSLVLELEPLASAAGVDLRLESAAPVRVRCASGILSSIVTNLVQNGIRHADEAEHRVDVRAVDAGREVRLEVEDTGRGVRSADRERIFEPYVRATEAGSGLGLGLATVKRLAESHGGHVGVRSPARGDHGSLFWVTLPVAPAGGHAARAFSKPAREPC